MTIKQFNGSYFPNEDRILFRFNTQSQEEYRFWLTRRTTLFILAATSHLLAKQLEQTHSPGAAKALTEFEKEAILESAKQENMATSPYEAGLNFPLGFDPILVLDVTCALTQKGEKLGHLADVKDGQIDDNLSIDFTLPGGANINLKLAGNILQTMCVLLDQLRQQAGWGEAVLQATNPSSDNQSLEVQTTKNTSIH
ncbi:hypothetical protein ICN46_11090 [Polynucleobacter sp. Latsch14-2]|uniref:hypothetical protein n=1 Tax=Polynucleobacter sp. Latsch14-2 TaxID=2576920 RepID=UPI001C0C3FD9|nr:hypothetical protein [Polynucleobacter sp. Latsch14-2]MBU3615435.1 hypothetical protein [Polynucleobacter sp. Latsch14-2]